MKNVVVFLIGMIGLVFFTQSAKSQVRTRQRVIDFTPITSPLNNSDIIFSIIRPDTNVLFCGFRNGINAVRVNPNNNGVTSKVSILKLDTSFNILDTLFFSDTVTLGPYISQSLGSQNIWIASTIVRTSPLRTAFSLRKIDPQGNTLFYRIDTTNVRNALSNVPSRVLFASSAKDGGVYVIGIGNKIINGSMQGLTMVSRFRPDGSVMWRTAYDSVPVPLRFNPNRVSFTRQGQLWLSGTNGAKVNGMTIDTATGRLISAATYYTHPRNMPWAQAAAVPTADGGYFVSGYVSTISDINVGYVAKLDRVLRVVREVNDSSLYQSAVTQAFRDSTAVTLGTVLGIRNRVLYNRYRRWGVRGEVLADVVFPQIPAFGETNYTLYSAAFSADGSAYYGGSIGSQALYLCKIDRIGIPYEGGPPPFGMSDSSFNAQPVSAQVRSHETKGWLQLYPSPSTGSLRVSHPGALTLLDAKGQIVLETTVVAGQTLDLSYLSAGIYLAKLQQAHLTRTGRWMKE